MAERERILVIDDEKNMRHMLAVLLEKEGYAVATAGDGKEGLDLASETYFDVILCDLKMPVMDGMAFLEKFQEMKLESTVIVMSAYGTMDTAIEAMKRGAYDYVSKPFKADEILLTLRKAEEREGLRRENRRLQRSIQERYSFANMIGRSPAMQEIFGTITKVAEYKTTVLITGESGTGKELVARALHARSPRRAHPFVALNCGALTETLLESEHFGHVKAAFTGANRDQKGLFEAANGGTIFLDEIGDIPLSTQVRLLRVLQEGEIKRVGSTDAIKVDARVIAATHRDLPKLVRAGKFREDLFYRLNVIAIPLPPLRDRLDDVPLLAHHFVRRYSDRLGKKVRTLSPQAVELLCGYRWPGNVRELENAIERAVVLCRGEAIHPTDLPPSVTGRTAPVLRDLPAGGDDVELLGSSYASAKDAALRRFEKRYVEALMKACDNNISAAARKAGMDRSNFKRVLRKYRSDVDMDDAEEPAEASTAPA
jgi:DNA-binding NtrC family response regulator